MSDPCPTSVCRLVGALVCLLPLLAAPARAQPEANTIEFRNCSLELPGTTMTARARCGALEVPENPAEPGGRKIKLRVAIVPAADRGAEPDPLFFFAGGPGQAASESWVTMRPILDRIRDRRDIVLVDQRGTGQSAPLDCPVPADGSLDAEVDLDRIVEATRNCLDQQEGDPRFYTTTVAMTDYDAVRQAMGYERINLLGISYGSRAAQVYARLFPEHVRSIILDGVVPMQLPLGSEHAPMLDRAVEVVFADCRVDPTCAALYPEGMTQLSALVQELRRAPKRILFTHPITGEPQEIRVDGDTLAVAIRFLNYSTETQALVPLLTHEAVSTGSLERLAAQAILVLTGLREQISRGMELSVICSEDVPLMSGDLDHRDTLLGNVMLETLRATCDVWPRGTVPADFHETLETDIPVLLLSGERDPVTPPSYAHVTAAGLADAIEVVAPGQGHMVIRHHCIQQIAEEFLDRGDTTGLDVSCVADIQPSPFFTSLLGPGP